MHKCARLVQRDFGGFFSFNLCSIASTSLVLVHTPAAAIASFAFEESVAVVDGNVIRLVSRYLGIQEPVNKGATLRSINTYVQEEIQGFKPDLFNQAIMEMGVANMYP